MLDYTWTCSCCGKKQQGLPLAWHFGPPYYFASVPRSERKRRTKLTDDICIADEHHFIRGLVELPIVGQSESLVYNVWVSLSADSMQRTQEIWNKRGRESEPPFFGWFNSLLPLSLYPSTLSLKAHVHTGPVGNAPLIELEPTDDPLAVEQRTGITIDRLIEISEAILPKH
jgi:hypothetical protein